MRKNFQIRHLIKGPYADNIFISQGSTGSSVFCCQMIAHIFLIVTPKFQLQIHYSLEVIAENVPISGIPIFNFLFIFITASSTVSHTCFCPRRENKKVTLKLICAKCVIGVKVNQFRFENTPVKMGTAPFKQLLAKYRLSRVLSQISRISKIRNI